MPSELEEAGRRFRAALLRREQAAASAMVTRYGQAWTAISGSLTVVTDQIVAARGRGEVVNQSWLDQQDRLRKLRAQVETELTEFGRFASDVTRQNQVDAIRAATVNAERAAMMKAAMADADAASGYQVSGQAQIQGIWSRLPTGAMEDLAGFSADGSPLATLFQSLGAETGTAMEEALARSLAMGLNPRQIAAEVRRATGMGLNRALLISRTETLRAYRETTSRTLEANAELLRGWVWVSGLGKRSCPACWAMHGTEHPVTEKLTGHPACRCVMVPFVKGTQHGVRKGSEVFTTLPEADKEAILGKSAYKAYHAGAATLDDFVGVKHSDLWGDHHYTRSLRSVLGKDMADTFNARRKTQVAGAAPAAAPASLPSVKPVVGRALTVAGATPEMEELLKWRLPNGYDSRGDLALAEIYRLQGFDGLPTLVTRGEMDALQASGEVSKRVYRGVNPAPDGKSSVDAYRTGKYHPGIGIYGNGTYTATNRETALNYGSNTEANILNMGISKQAKITTHDQVRDEFREFVDKTETRHSMLRNNWENTTTAEKREFRLLEYLRTDEGRLAAFNGYDGYTVPQGNHEYIVILNRTITYVETGTREGRN